MADEKAPVKKEKKTREREKKERTGRKHESLKIWEYYVVKDSDIERKRNPCPRCGPGAFLSEHKDRYYCGRCGFTQIEKSGSTRKAEAGQGEPAGQPEHEHKSGEEKGQKEESETKEEANEDKETS